MKKSVVNPALGLIGAAVLGGSATIALADANPFAVTELGSGYQLAQAEKDAEGKCGEGKCGGEKTTEAEGKCGGQKTTEAEGKCGAEKTTEAEGKCGEGKCGGKN